MKYITITASAQMLILALVTPTNANAESENCAAIENARERLACFDRLFPRDDNATPLPEIRNEVIKPPETLGDAPQTSSPEPAASSGSGAPIQGQSSDQGEGRGGLRGVLDKTLFEWQADVEFTATVAAVKAEESQRMVFRLDNDEIWMQTSPRYVPIKKGDEVTIKSGTIGGYVMRNQNDTSTRVRRIR